MYSAFFRPGQLSAFFQAGRSPDAEEGLDAEEVAAGQQGRLPGKAEKPLSGNSAVPEMGAFVFIPGR